MNPWKYDRSEYERWRKQKHRERRPLEPDLAETMRRIRNTKPIVRDLPPKTVIDYSAAKPLEPWLQNFLRRVMRGKQIQTPKPIVYNEPDITPKPLDPEMQDLIERVMAEKMIPTPKVRPPKADPKPMPKWLSEIRDRNMGITDKPDMDWAEYERNRQAKHAVPNETKG